MTEHLPGRDDGPASGLLGPRSVALSQVIGAAFGVASFILTATSSRRIGLLVIAAFCGVAAAAAGGGRLFSLRGRAGRDPRWFAAILLAASGLVGVGLVAVVFSSAAMRGDGTASLPGAAPTGPTSTPGSAPTPTPSPAGPSQICTSMDFTNSVTTTVYVDLDTCQQHTDNGRPADDFAFNDARLYWNNPQDEGTSPDTAVNTVADGSASPSGCRGGAAAPQVLHLDDVQQGKVVCVLTSERRWVTLKFPTGDELTKPTVTAEVRFI